MQAFLRNIPTNVITGFLGVGKTTAILHLLQHKPAGETWAVLVNEFGQIGIDGQLLQQDGVEIREIPGGCMCCSAGVSVQVGLNALVARARPDRLLIEPTGVGHPREIIKQLSRPPFDQLLDMRACICLVDPRHLNNARYVSNDNFQQQLDIADVLVANKTDEASDVDRAAFDALVAQRAVEASGWVDHGQLDAAWLALPHKTEQAKAFVPVQAPLPSGSEAEVLSLEPGERFRRLENHDRDFQSCGWLFADDTVFAHEGIITALRGIDAERIKATLKTDRGHYAINSVDGDTAVELLEAPRQNRIEIISAHTQDWDRIETALLQQEVDGE